MNHEEKERRRKEFFDISEKRRVLVERAVAASKEDAKKIFEELIALQPKMCEHGRYWTLDCMACDNIHKEVFPELYKQCTKCKELVDPDDINKKGKCFNCQGE